MIMKPFKNELCSLERCFRLYQLKLFDFINFDYYEKSFNFKKHDWIKKKYLIVTIYAKTFFKIKATLDKQLKRKIHVL